jgi:hypothetical protein
MIATLTRMCLLADARTRRVPAARGLFEANRCIFNPQAPGVPLFGTLF